MLNNSVAQPYKTVSRHCLMTFTVDNMYTSSTNHLVINYATIFKTPHNALNLVRPSVGCLSISDALSHVAADLRLKGQKAKVT